MQIDFHTHVILTKKLRFSMENFLAVVAEAKNEGLTAMAMTEHFNTLRFYELYQILDDKFDYKNDYYDVDGFKVFPGMEVDVLEGGHILLVTNRCSLRQLREQLDRHVTDETFIPVAQLLNLVKSHQVLKIGAHPFRASNSLYQLDDDILKNFDAFDLNGKDMNSYGIDDMITKVQGLADKYEVAVVAGSDTHHPLQMGCVRNEFTTDCNTINELREQIKSRAYKRHISLCLNTKVRAAVAVKKLLKEKLEPLS